MPIHKNNDPIACCSCHRDARKLHEDAAGFPYECMGCGMAFCDECVEIIQLGPDPKGKFNENSFNDDPRALLVYGVASNGPVIYCGTCLQYKEITFIDSLPVGQLPLWIHFKWGTYVAEQYFKQELANGRKHYE